MQMSEYHARQSPTDCHPSMATGPLQSTMESLYMKTFLTRAPPALLWTSALPCVSAPAAVAPHCRPGPATWT
eukprot:CAMPEP_0175785592 /NCGR_PEP_ID=MMETSP0097-20121207/79409_1 /TAXON_ID=311494 /ORGANISM="Alexandrium monilatum, Strain CCMP3105" /LENGTH=71 /DNA_ID=CAMNT_0017096511 /DNA_START=278 /DNA_END=490 /DNA_ORIENTATION=-